MLGADEEARPVEGLDPLRDGEARWRLLFERNPLPMWVFDVETLRFMAVNEAAVLQYGWTPSEFRSMSLKDIRPPEDVALLMADLAEGHDTLHGGKVWRHRRKNGEYIHVDIVAHSLDFEGRSARLVLAQDVTERLRATQALRASEARWQRLFEASAIGIASASIDGLFVSANPAFCALVRRTEQALIGQPILGFTHPDDLPLCRYELDRLAAGQCETVTVDKRYLRPAGEPRWARATITMTNGDDLRAGGRQFVAIVQDIDAQHAAETALRRQRALVDVAGRLARLGGWEMVNDAQRTVRWTDELRVILDIPTGEVPGIEAAIGMYPPGSRERIAAALQTCLDEGQPFDLQADMSTALGRPLRVRVIGEPRRGEAGHIEGVHGALVDQTELHLAQQALRHSEERFRHVARATADAIWDWDMATGAVWWNEGIETLFGHASADLAPGVESWTSRIHPEDLVRVRSDIDAAIAGSGERWSADYRFARADGSWAEVHDRGFVIRDEHGIALRMLGGMSDLTAQRRAERRLLEQAALLDATRDAILVHDIEGRITYWSRGAERLFGWTSAEAIGRVAPELQGVAPVVSNPVRDALLQLGEWQGLIQCRDRQGRALKVDMRLTLLRDGSGNPDAVLAIQSDVTQRVALEAQLQQAQRLEALGQLTGGVAHDFNNLLTVMQGNAELLMEHLSPEPPWARLAEMISTAAQRGAELTQRLLAFARRQPLQPMSMDAHQLLSGMDALLRRTLPKDIELELVRAAGLWPLLADAAQLESAVLNLVLNARDAMPEGGKITLETANAWVDQDYAERHVDVLPGQYVLISVSDTGTGMSPGALARAFEPFFTTKATGKGSGLGLSMVYGFAKQSRGHVKLYSEPGHGTTVRLYLPRADSAAVATTGQPRVHGDLRGSATLLVVEDDDLVRRFATELLRGLGYQTLSADNGAAAMVLLRERDDIELLFTDVVMPGGMNGRQLADAALALRPQLKVLFTSGYTENAIVHHGRLDRGVHLLSKPYRAVDLAQKIRALLA